MGEKAIKSKVNILAAISAYHRYEINLPDREIDRLLNINFQTESDINHENLIAEKGLHQYFYEGTPYSYIRYLLNALRIKGDDVVYDLGSGYGRFVLYGAVAAQGLYKGVEIVKERVDASNASKDSIGIERAEFINGNVLSVDFADGNYFFLFNPFFLDTLDLVGQKLMRISKKKPIVIITWGGSSNDYFMDQSWLDEIRLLDNQYKLQFFKSSNVY